MDKLIAVLDANVIYSAPLRDTLFRAEQMGLYQMRLSEEIIDEAVRNLISDGKMTPIQAQRFKDVISTQFSASFVEDSYRLLIDKMRNDPKDRHVLAAAVSSGAHVIVTYNLQDFPQEALESYGIIINMPDTFLLHLYEHHRAEILQLFTMQAQTLQRPPLTFDQLLDRLAIHAPIIVQRIRSERATPEEPHEPTS